MMMSSKRSITIAILAASMAIPAAFAGAAAPATPPKAPTSMTEPTAPVAQTPAADPAMQAPAPNVPAADTPVPAADASMAIKTDSWHGLDANNDGSISKDEAAANPDLGKNFAKYDKNKDGVLSTDEFNTYLAKTTKKTGKNKS